MFKGILHRMVTYPIVYDTVQRITGSKKLHQYLMGVAKELPQEGIVLDLGGGTGIYRDVWKDAQLYISLDNDILKAAGFRDNCPSYGVPLLADAANIPLKNNSVDVIQCTLMSHHLQDSLFHSLIEESFRVLKKNGSFIFMDAFWLPESIISKFLWSIDRGSYPKNKKMLLSTIETKFKIIKQKEIRIYHSYLLCLGKKL